MTKYSDSYVQKKGNLFAKNRTIRSSQSTSRLGPVSNTIIIFAILSLIGLLYLNQVKKTGEYSSQIQQMRAEQATLQETNRSLEVRTLRMKSLANTNQAAKDLGLVKPENVEVASPVTR